MTEGIYFMIIIFVILLIILIGVAIARFYRGGNIGASCSSTAANSGCGGGAVCDANTNTCRVPVGSRCTSATDCITGSTCTGNVCVMNTPPVTSGITSTINGVGMSCTPTTMNGVISTSVCPTGTVCDSNSGTCRVPLGGQCNLSTDCASGSVCMSNVCVSSNNINNNMNNNNNNNMNNNNMNNNMNYMNNMNNGPIMVGSNMNRMNNNRRVHVPFTIVDLESTDASRCSPRRHKHDKHHNKHNRNNRCDDECDDDSRSNTSDDIIDAFEIGRKIGYLYIDGVTIKMPHVNMVIKNNTRLSRIECVGNKLYAISFGELYWLDVCETNHSEWKWIRCPVHKKGLIHMSSTHDKKHLWIQTDTKGFLYKCDMSLQLVETVDTFLIRNYGRHKKEFVEINIDCCSIKVNINGGDDETNTEVCYAVIDKNGQLHGIEKDDFDGISMVKIINNETIVIYKQTSSSSMC